MNEEESNANTEKPKESEPSPEKEPAKDFVGIQDGWFVVRISLQRDNAETWALGTLERAKSIIQGYFFAMAKAKQDAAKVNIQASKGFIDRITRHH